MRKLLLTLTAMLFFSGMLLAQKVITGKVVDDKGSPVPNASVTVKGAASTGTVTGIDGGYSLTVPATAKELEISAVGFAPLTVTLDDKSFYSTTLSSRAQDIDEVVVTGYTSTKRSKYAGASTVVNKDKINFIPNASFDQILQGRAPGLLVTAGSGQPGAAARVQLRGQASISGGSGPLYILDGMPIEAAVFQSLNPNDFEDVQVLRDAVATAQYGNRGGNGVIIITSKRGKAGKPQLTYTGQVGITEPGKQQFNMMNTAQLLEFQEVLGRMGVANLPGWQYSRNNPAYAASTPTQQAATDRFRDSLLAINTDWRDVFLRNGKFTSHDVNLTGGSATSNYFLGLGYYDEDGIGLRSDLKRYTLRANMNIKTDKLTAQFNNSVGYTRRNFIESEASVTLANPFAAAYLGLPYQKLFNDNGTVSVGSGRVGPNAYDRVFTTTSFNDQIKANTAYSLEYAVTKNVYVGGFGGIDYRVTIAERSVFPNTWAANSSGFPVGPDVGQTTGRGSYNNGLTNFFQLVTRAYAGYRNRFNKHDLDVKVLAEYTREKQKAFSYTGYGINPKLLETPAGITAGSVDNKLIPAVGGSKTGRTLSGILGTINYTYNDRYTLNASIRRDASSQLSEDQRWVNFYGAGVAWNILKEDFTTNWNKVSDLRLRFSYGSNANADGFYFGNFGYLPLFGAGSYAGSNPTLAPSNAGNLNVTWEKLITANLGLDYGFFRNRVYGTLDVYHRKTIDNIIPQTISATGGFGDGASIPVNAGIVVNKGVELAINADIIKTNDLLFTVGGNIAYNKNEVTDLGQVAQFEQGTELVKVGLPLGSHYMVRWGGVDAATGRPLYYTKDGVLTNVYSASNSVSDFGTYNAPWIGGFNAGVQYKGISLNAFFTFQKGFSRFNNQDYFQLNHAFALQGYNLRTEMETMWKNPGDVTDIQSPLYAREFVSKDIQDASYLRFRNLSLAYQLPSSIIGKLKYFAGIRIYAQAQNLYTWTKWTGFDPEDSNNIAQYEYPLPRTYTIGLQVNFK
ncbi:SusC/RagA family TonB-linked outer membrane protein [Terrimonas ferruginea]|uniref:SusC/RagA family TonB-linked outer membrane protein n=1 Tax=Terrimonas ferruginea TaxID=249 RepID=UPI0004113C86|nr:SusC/RagA family TonB-linked outer membrane protein [Terrimonas ferruginea]